jgi:hypothetical protein
VRKKRTEIVIELDEVFVIRRRQTISFAWCRECGAQVQMLIPDEAATLAGFSSRFIYRRIEAGSLHFSETGDGHLLICQSSLSKLIEKGEYFNE